MCSLLSMAWGLTARVMHAFLYGMRLRYMTLHVSPCYPRVTHADEDLMEAAQGLVTAAAGNSGRPLRVLPLSRRLRQLPSSSEYYEECAEPSV